MHDNPSGITDSSTTIIFDRNLQLTLTGSFCGWKLLAILFIKPNGFDVLYIKLSEKLKNCVTA